MKSIIYTGIMVILWLVNLFNGTGLGNALHTTEYAKKIVWFLFIASVVVQYTRTRKLSIQQQIFYSHGIMMLFFIVVSFVKGRGIECFDYVWVYMLIYLLQKLLIDEKTIKYISLSYGILGIFILFIYNYSSILSGWNDNEIGMLGLHSYLVFIIPYYKVSRLKEKIMLILVSGIYIFLIRPTDSRSSVLFVIIGLLFALSFLSQNLIIGKTKNMIAWLLIPLIVAGFVVIISPLRITEKLNLWSWKNFDKPIFNGRDKIWEMGFQTLLEHILTGTGKIDSGYWHNSAISCLTAFGVLGYSGWIYSIYNFLKQGEKWIKDKIVVGLISSFVLLYVHQSVELGIFGRDPKLLPYIMLGLLLGRIGFLNRRVS